MTIKLASAEPTISPAQAKTFTTAPETVVIEAVHPRLHTADALRAEELERQPVGKVGTP